MKNTLRILSLVLAVLVFSMMLISCAGNNQNETNNTQPYTEPATAEKTEQESSEPETEVETEPATEGPSYTEQFESDHFFSDEQIENGEIVFPFEVGYLKDGKIECPLTNYHTDEFYLDNTYKINRFFRFFGWTWIEDDEGLVHYLEFKYGYNTYEAKGCFDPQILLDENRVVIGIDGCDCFYVDKSDMKIYYQKFNEFTGKGSEPVAFMQSEIYTCTMKGDSYDSVISEDVNSPVVSVEYFDKDDSKVVIFRTENGNEYYYLNNEWFDEDGYNRTYKEDGEHYTSHMARIAKIETNIFSDLVWKGLSEYLRDNDKDIYLRLETREEEPIERLTRDPESRGQDMLDIREYCPNTYLHVEYLNDIRGYYEDIIGFYGPDETSFYACYTKSTNGSYERIRLPEGYKMSDINWDKTVFLRAGRGFVTFKDGKCYKFTGSTLELSNKLTEIIDNFEEFIICKVNLFSNDDSGVLYAHMDDGYYYFVDTFYIS